MQEQTYEALKGKWPMEPLFMARVQANKEVLIEAYRKVLRHKNKVRHVLHYVAIVASL